MGKRFEFKEVEHPLDLYDTEIAIVDNETDNIISYDNACIVLNEQDKKIKELESQVEKLKQDYENCSRLEKILTKEHQYCLDNWIKCQEENQQFKQSQNSKAIEVLERLRQDFFGNPYNGKHEYIVGEIIDKIDIQITELRGGEND